MKLLSFLLLAAFIPGFWESGITNTCKVAIDSRPHGPIDEHLQGIWKLAEDTDRHNYFIIEQAGDSIYVITYMNRSGDNRGLEHGSFYWSDINGVKFISIRNWDDNHPGYIFYKVKELDHGRWDMTACLVTDPSIQKMTTPAELRALLTKNLNNPNFYGRDLHFTKKFEFNSFGPR